MSIFACIATLKLVLCWCFSTSQRPLREMSTWLWVTSCVPVCTSECRSEYSLQSKWQQKRVETREANQWHRKKDMNELGLERDSALLSILL